MRVSSRLRDDLAAAIDAYAERVVELFVEECGHAMRKRAARRGAVRAHVRFDAESLPGNTNASTCVDGFPALASRAASGDAGPAWLVALAFLGLIANAVLPAAPPRGSIRPGGALRSVP